MNKQISFTLKEEHLKLLEQLNVRYDYGRPYKNSIIPQIDNKRVFGNSTGGYEDIAEILGLEPEDGKEFSEQQKNYCFRLMIELVPALNVIFKYRTFELGKYILDDSDSSYYYYLHAKNALTLEPVIAQIEKEFDETTLKQLREVAMNISCDKDDCCEVYKAFYKSLSFNDPEFMKSKNIPWLTSALEKLEDLISNTIEEKKG